ncbi:hypothetical protein BS17DRAFT_765426 [Gyrodon lividus]|nr:hypothetical protein BS17DRAFT_765426 [Gyrodon lividus]
MNLLACACLTMSLTITCIFLYSLATLTSQTLCPHYGKTFNVQGFKKHEASCKGKMKKNGRNSPINMKQNYRAQCKVKGKLMSGPASGPEEVQAGPSRRPSTSEPLNTMIEDPPLYAVEIQDLPR